MEGSGQTEYQDFVAGFEAGATCDKHSLVVADEGRERHVAVKV